MQTALFTKVFGDRSLEEAVELTAEVGYDAVEFMCRDPHLGPDTTPEEARDLRDKLDDLGLDVAGLGTYTGHYLGKDEAEREETLAEFEHFCELAGILGTDLVRHGPGGPPERDATDAEYEDAAEWMRRAADVAADYDKRIGIEIHVGTIVESAPTTADFIDRIGRDNVGAIHDAGNMYIADVDYTADSLSALGDRLFHVHVKDERRVDDDSLPGSFTLETDRGEETFQHTLFGEGAVDQRALFAALVDVGYDGSLSNECHRATDEEWTDLAIAEHELAAVEDMLADVGA